MKHQVVRIHQTHMSPVRRSVFNQQPFGDAHPSPQKCRSTAMVFS